MNTRSAAVERATAGTAFFDTQAKRWIGLYDSKARAMVPVDGARSGDDSLILESVQVRP